MFRWQRLRLLEDAGLDFRFGLRSLKQHATFSTLAVLTVAFGIGAASAILSVVNGVLLAPLPYRESARLVHATVNVSGAPDGFIPLSQPEYLDLESASSFGSLAAYFGDVVTMGDSLAPNRVRVMRVSANLLPLLGVNPQLGRYPSPEDRVYVLVTGS